MEDHSFRCFTQIDDLRTVSAKLLVRLLLPYAGFLESKGLRLPKQAQANHLDYASLASILMTPDEDMPQDLIESLYCINEMSTPEGMDNLLDGAAVKGITIDMGSKLSPMDVAIWMWLQDRDVFEREHAEHFHVSPCTFVCFQSAKKPDIVFHDPGRDVINALEKDLDNWFDGRNRGRGSRVIFYPREGGIRFLIRHGEPFKREGCIENGRSSCIYYRPEKHDLLIYQPITGELQIHAGANGETEAYRMLLGRHLFGDDHHFPGIVKYTLEPLKTDGEMSLVCSDIPEMEHVTLREIRYFWGGKYSECEIHKADDIFAVLEDRNEKIPQEPRLIKACFQVKFSDSKTPRSVSIRPSNIAQYCRDSDCDIIEEWLAKRGFIAHSEHE